VAAFLVARVWGRYLYRRPYESAWVADLGRLYVNGSLFGIRQGRWKYIESDALGTRELFDLEEDPPERRNLAAANPDKLRELAARLRSWRERETLAGPAEVSPEDREALRAFGYVD
jgi:arylsulfatase A-like enzyme